MAKAGAMQRLQPTFPSLLPGHFTVDLSDSEVEDETADGAIVA